MVKNKGKPNNPKKKKKTTEGSTILMNLNMNDYNESVPFMTAD